MPAYRIYLSHDCPLERKFVGGMTVTRRPQISFALPEGAREDPDVVVEERRLRREEKRDLLGLYTKK